MSDFTDTENKPWNMAGAFLQRLDKRLDEAQIARAEGNVLKWYRLLCAIYNQIYFKIIEKGNDKEEKELELSFEEVKGMLMQSKMLNTIQQQGALSQVELKLSDVEKQLSLLLHSYNLIFAKEEWDDPGTRIETGAF